MRTDIQQDEAKRRSAECILRFLLWARDEAHEVLDDKVAITGFDFIREHLKARFGIAEETLLDSNISNSSAPH